MGYYINETKNGTPLPAIGKAKMLILDDEKNIRIKEANVDVTFEHLKENEALVCVVENGPFDAAVYAY